MQSAKYSGEAKFIAAFAIYGARKMSTKELNMPPKPDAMSAAFNASAARPCWAIG